MTLILLILVYVLLESCNRTNIQKTLYNFHYSTMYLADLYRHIIFLIQCQEGKLYV